MKECTKCGKELTTALNCSCKHSSFTLPIYSYDDKQRIDMEGLRIPRKVTFTWPIWGNKEEMLLSLKDITGSTAMWAIKQSPYPKPDNLEEALKYLRGYINSRLEFCELGFVSITIEDLRKFLIKAYEETPEIAAWNEPKIETDNIFQGSSNRYHTTKPDYDFIDLHAMARNVAHACGMEYFYWKERA